MKISVLGTGNMGKAIVKQVAAYVKVQVLLGSRNPTEAAELAKGFQLDQIVAGTYEEALQADIIIPGARV